MQFGKDFDHWPTTLGGPMVKILGGPKDTLAHPLKFLGGPWPPWPPPPPVPPPLEDRVSKVCHRTAIKTLQVSKNGLSKDKFRVFKSTARDS